MNYMISQNKAVKPRKLQSIRKTEKNKFKISLNKNQSKSFWNEILARDRD